MFPGFYQPDRVGTLYAPNTLAAINAGRQLGLPPARHDKVRIALLIIDVQTDFIHADGALSIPGAIEDTRRTVEWMYRNTDRLTTVAASLDSHLPIQIFSPAWWVDRDGAHPAPYTAIPHADVADSLWTPLYEVEWSREYTRLLEEQARKQLMIWPYHTLIGTPGHSLTPALYEAIAYHASARATQPALLQKGSDPRTEHYSIFEPEVKVPGAGSGFNREFLEILAGHDLIYVAGQAKSHCLLETVTSVMRTAEPTLIGKLRLLADTTSSVAHPDIDFDAMAARQFERFAAQGLTLTDTQAALP